MKKESFNHFGRNSRDCQMQRYWLLKKAIIQDATFIKSDPGRSGNKLRGDEDRTRRSKDGKQTNKGDEFFFGFKLHDKVDIDGVIRSIEVTAASIHDSQVDLSLEGERVYRDKGYFGSPARGRSVTMLKQQEAIP